MAGVTLGSRLTGYLRDKVLAYVLGAGQVYDAFLVAFTIPNTFRALLAEGALHAAFIPSLARVADKDEEREEARALVQAMLASLTVILAMVVGVGILASPWLVRLFAEGFTQHPGQVELAVWMNRLMFPYLALISLAALCQGVLNTHDRFILPAVTPILLNLALVTAGVLLSHRIASPKWVLPVAVLAGGLLQFLAQAVALPKLGYSLAPAWGRLFDARVRQVLWLMLPGIPVLGIQQLNQLVSRRFASLTGAGGVTFTYNAYRITELVFGVVVVQITTVLLPTLSRHVAEDPVQARRTLREALSLVGFVTLPSLAVLAVASRSIVGLLFGGGRYTPAQVTVTGQTLRAYAFGLLGLAAAKVLASAFYARKDTRTPMWGSLVSLAVFAGLCAVLAPRLGPPGIGWANAVAVTAYGTFLVAAFGFRHGYGRSGTLVLGLARQAVAAVVMAWGVRQTIGWVGTVDHTSLGAALRLGGLLAAAGVGYVLFVQILGGQEPGILAGIFRRATPGPDEL